MILNTLEDELVSCTEIEEEPPCAGCIKANIEGECDKCQHKDNTIWH